MKKLVAKRKRTGVSKPLLNPRVIITQPPKNFPILLDEIDNCLGSEVIGKWIGYLKYSQDILPDSVMIRIDKLTDHSVTGPRIFLRPENRGSDYATVNFSEIELFYCLNPQPDLSPDKVVIACISGRGGGSNNGMTRLRDTLRNRFRTAYGINPNNIFHRSWNNNQDSDPFGAPLVNDLLREINRRTPEPIYLAIIGHSYGGWAACKISRRTKITPNFVGLVDPVFGSTNTFNSGDAPRGKQIVNWFQDNGISGNTCGNKINCVPVVNGISCGFQDVPRAVRTPVKYLRTAAGAVRTVNCPDRGSVPRLAFHVNIDDDARIHRLIFDQINSDLSKLIKK